MHPAPKCLTRGRFLPNDPSLPSCLMEAPTTDPNLCLSTAILGRESQSISTQWSLPFGDECSRIEAVCEEVHYFKQAGHPQRFRKCHTWSPRLHHLTYHNWCWRHVAQSHENSVGRWHHLSIAQVPIWSQDQGQGDSTASPAMADTKDTQPSPMETPPVDDTTVPSAESNTKTKNDLLTAQATSPAKLENQVAPTAGSVDKLARPPTPSGCTVKERKCVSTLTASMEILNLEPPSVVIGHQGARVEELSEGDLVEGCPWMCSSSPTSLKEQGRWPPRNGVTMVSLADMH